MLLLPCLSIDLLGLYYNGHLRFNGFWIPFLVGGGGIPFRSVPSYSIPFNEKDNSVISSLINVILPLRSVVWFINRVWLKYVLLVYDYELFSSLTLWPDLQTTTDSHWSTCRITMIGFPNMRQIFIHLLSHVPIGRSLLLKIPSSSTTVNLISSFGMQFPWMIHLNCSFRRWWSSVLMFYCPDNSSSGGYYNLTLIYGNTW